MTTNELLALLVMSARKAENLDNNNLEHGDYSFWFISSLVLCSIFRLASMWQLRWISYMRFHFVVHGDRVLGKFESISTNCRS